MAKDKLLQTLDPKARDLALGLVQNATHGALAVISPETGTPSVTRVALATTPDGQPVSLVSGLATHTPALEADPRCSLLLGDVGPKGDPMTHPRLTLHCRAVFVERDSAAHDRLRAHFLEQRPKSKLYIDLPDFRFVRFEVIKGMMNGGFARAYALTPEDLNRVI